MKIGKKFFFSCISWEYVSFSLLLYVCLPSFILSVFLLLDVGSPQAAYWLSAGGLVAGLVYGGSRGKVGAADCLLFLLILLLTHAVSYMFFDTFYDGFAYHQPAISRIAAGFNPIYDGYMDLGHSFNIWSDAATYYPKALWYFAASVTAAWGDIQLGKAYHLILVFSASLFVFHYSSGSVLKKLLWVAACFNPIAATQFLSYNVDVEVGTFTLMALLYACFFFECRVVPKLVHVFGIIALAMLFCTKSSGFAYGGIVMFCIALNAAVKAYRVPSAAPLTQAVKCFFKAAAKLGVPVLALASIMGFSPYIDNLIEGRHLFYPLVHAQGVSSPVDDIFESQARNIYPGVSDRFSRFVLSVFSYPMFMQEDHPAVLKNPVSAPPIEWRTYAEGDVAKAAGLGPLFPLLLIVAALYQIFLRGKGNFWLLFTLVFLIFVQPHAWLVRLVPFVWLLPFILLMSVPEKKEYLLVVPLLIAATDTLGVGYIATAQKLEYRRMLEEKLEPHRGRYVLLDKSMFQFDGIFDRFGIKQKFSEQKRHIPWPGFKWAEKTGALRGREPTENNVAFEEDIPVLPRSTVFLNQDTDSSRGLWAMSDGLVLYDSEFPAFSGVSASVKVNEGGCWNYTDMVRFFMRVPEAPSGDMVFVLAAVPEMDASGNAVPQIVTVFVNSVEIGAMRFDRDITGEKAVVVPCRLLKESYEDEMSLFSLKLYIAYADDSDRAGRKPAFSLMFESVEFRDTAAGDFPDR